jgi:Holliday junction resolvase
VEGGVTPEGKIKAEIREYLDKTGWYAFNVAQFNKKGYKIHGGISDLIAIKNGQVLFIEVKTPTGTLLESQVEFSREIVEHGGKYVIARSVEDLMEIADKLRKKMEEMNGFES